MLDHNKSNFVLQILQPMANRFLTGAIDLQSGHSHLTPHLVDLLECFSGIAKGAQIESGNILYGKEKFF